MSYYKKPYCVSCYVNTHQVKKLHQEADKLFSEWVRKRDMNRCRNIFAKKHSEKLECSHFWGRRHYSTRYDPDNCITLCHACHSKWEGEKQGEYRDLMIGWLGQERYDDLERKHYQIVKQRDAIEEFFNWYYGDEGG
jgi:hypothetical protein